MKLRITTDSADFFLQPGSGPNGAGAGASASGSTTALEEDTPTLAIRVHLDTGPSPPTRIDQLTVSIASHETMAFPSGRYEQTQLFEWTQDVRDARGMRLAPNTLYTFETLFRVPGETAEYHRSQYGRRYQKAHVRLVAPAFLRSRTWTLDKNLFFVHLPASDEAFSFSRTETGFAEGLGVVVAKATSAHLNVGGYLRVWLDVPARSPDIEIQRFEVSLLQYFTLRSRSDPKIEEACPVQRWTFLSVPGRDLEEGHWIARLPDDSVARPSSYSVLERGIIITHAFEFALTYAPKADASSSNSSTSKDASKAASKAAPTPPKTLRLRWPISLPSCALRYHSLRLPAYSKRDAAPVPERDRDDFAHPNEHLSTEHCVCGQPLSTLLAIEGELRAGPPLSEPGGVEGVVGAVAGLAAEEGDGDGTATPTPTRRVPMVLDELWYKFDSGTRTPKTPG